jgi:hypothetical protein
MLSRVGCRQNNSEHPLLGLYDMNYENDMNYFMSHTTYGLSRVRCLLREAALESEA